MYFILLAFFLEFDVTIDVMLSLALSSLPFSFWGAVANHVYVQLVCGAPDCTAEPGADDYFAFCFCSTAPPLPLPHA